MIVEIGTLWKDGRTNTDGIVRRYNNLKEAIHDFPLHVDQYFTNNDCVGIFIDEWIESNNGYSEPTRIEYCNFNYNRGDTYNEC